MHADEPRRHYAKWNKTRHRRHILYDLTYTQNLKNPDSEPAIARAGVWQKWGDVGQWYKLSVTGWISSGNLMHSKVIIINNTAFSWNLLRE